MIGFFVKTRFKKNYLAFVTSKLEFLFKNNKYLEYLEQQWISTEFYFLQYNFIFDHQHASLLYSKSAENIYNL